MAEEAHGIPIHQIDAIDKAIAAAKSIVPTQDVTKEWTFINARSENQLEIRRIIRKSAARKRKVKKISFINRIGNRYAGVNDDIKNAIIRLRETTPLCQPPEILTSYHTTGSTLPPFRLVEKDSDLLEEIEDLANEQNAPTPVGRPGYPHGAAFRIIHNGNPLGSDCRSSEDHINLRVSEIHDSAHQPQIARQGSPVSVLGAGRVDPFRTFPVASSSIGFDECFDHFVNFFIPNRYPLNEQGPENSLLKAWMPEAFSEPLLFHTIMICASRTLDILRGNSANHLLFLYDLGQMIKIIRKAFNDLGITSLTSERIILPINSMATWSGNLMIGANDSPFNTPLSDLYAVRIGRLQFNEAHCKALYDLVRIRGGLHTLQIPYVKSIMSFEAIEAATLALKSSPFPYIPEFIIEWRSSLETNHIFKSTSGRGRLLEKLCLFGFSNDVLCLSYDLCEQTEQIEGYCQRSLAMSTAEKIAYDTMRYQIQHRLISLPPMDDQPVYESYRLSLWMYSFAVTFAGAFHISTRKTLVQKLVHALERTEHCSTWDLFPEALLWILFFGGISATGLPERKWFVKKTSILLTRLELEQWEETKLILQSVLWLGIACDSGGKVLWSEACLSRIPPR